MIKAQNLQIKLLDSKMPMITKDSDTVVTIKKNNNIWLTSSVRNYASNLKDSTQYQFYKITHELWYEYTCKKLTTTKCARHKQHKQITTTTCKTRVGKNEYK